MSDGTRDIGYTEHGHVGVLTLNRPGAHNALRPTSRSGSRNMSAGEYLGSTHVGR
jgi:enoyl-CoA hydratase/carnithine racemase